MNWKEFTMKYGGGLTKYQKKGEVAIKGRPTVAAYRQQYQDEIASLKDWYEKNRSRINASVPSAYLRNQALAPGNQSNDPYQPGEDFYPAYNFSFPELSFNVNDQPAGWDYQAGIPKSFTHRLPGADNVPVPFVTPKDNVLTISDSPENISNYVSEAKISGIKPNPIGGSFTIDAPLIMSHELGHYLNYNNPEVSQFNKQKLAETGITNTKAFQNYYGLGNRLGDSEETGAMRIIEGLSKDRKYDEFLSDAYALKQAMRREGLYDYTKGEKLTPEIWNKFKDKYGDQLVYKRFTDVFQDTPRDEPNTKNIMFYLPDKNSELYLKDKEFWDTKEKYINEQYLPNLNRERLYSLYYPNMNYDPADVYEFMEIDQPPPPNIDLGTTYIPGVDIPTEEGPIQYRGSSLRQTTLPTKLWLPESESKPGSWMTENFYKGYEKTQEGRDKAYQDFLKSRRSNQPLKSPDQRTIEFLNEIVRNQNQDENSFMAKYGGGLTKYQKKGEFNWKTYKDVGIQPLPSKSQIAAAQGQQRENTYVKPVVKNAAQLQRINQIQEEERQRRIQETADRVRGTLRATTDADIEAQNREDYTLTGRARSLGRGDFNPLVLAAGVGDLINPASYWYAGKDFGRGVKQTGEGMVNLDPEQIGSGLFQTGLSALQLYPGVSTAKSVIKGTAPRLFGSTMSSQADDFLRSVRSMDDFATGSPPVYRTQPGLSSGPVSSTPAISRVGNTSRSANFSKNLDDLKYASKFARTYGYTLPSNLERVAESDVLTDRTIRGMMNRHNTFARGVSTNYDKLPPEVIENLKKQGFDLRNDPEAAAIYMGTTIPPATGYGRVGIPQSFIDQGNEALYSSNSLGTGEGYTYGDGYIVTAKRPTDFSSSSRLDWIKQNNPNYYKEIPQEEFKINGLKAYYNPADPLIAGAIDTGKLPASIGRNHIPILSFESGEEYRQATIAKLENALNESLKSSRKDEAFLYTQSQIKDLLETTRKQNWDVTKPVYDPNINIFKAEGAYTQPFGKRFKQDTPWGQNSLLQYIPSYLAKNPDNAAYHKNMLEGIEQNVKNFNNKNIEQLQRALSATANQYAVSTGDDYIDLYDFPKLYGIDPGKAYENYKIADYANPDKLRSVVLNDLKREAFKDKLGYLTGKILPSQNKSLLEAKRASYEQIQKRINEIKNQKWEKPNISHDEQMDILNQKDDLIKKVVDEKVKYLDKNFPSWQREKDRYGHYVFLGKPGEQVLEPISTQRITPEIYKNTSRAHYGDYTPGFSALSLIPAGLSIGAIQQYLENQRQKPKGTYQYGGPTIDLKLPQFEKDKPRPFFEMSGAGTGPQYDVFGYGYVPLGKNLGISADLMGFKEGDWRGGRYGISGNINIPINRGERRTRPDVKDLPIYQKRGEVSYSSVVDPKTKRINLEAFDRLQSLLKEQELIAQSRPEGAKTLPEIQIVGERPGLGSRIRNAIKPYVAPEGGFLDQWRQRIVDATGGSNWYKQPNSVLNAFSSIVTSPLQAPQYAAVYAATDGKLQLPSEALNIQNPVGSFLTDVALDPMTYVGLGVSKIPQKIGQAAIPSIEQAGKYLTTQTPLRNTYKINPFAFKPQEGMMYRGLGEEGFADAIQSGVFRPKQQGYSEGRTLAEKVSSPKQFGSVFYAPAERFGVVENYGPSYLAEVPFAGNQFARRYGRKDWSWSTPRQIPIEEGRILQKDWLRGYKPVEINKQLPGSPNTINQAGIGLIDVKGAFQKYPKGPLTQEEITAYRNSPYYQKVTKEHLDMVNKYGDQWRLGNYMEDALQEAIATGNRSRVNSILYGGRNWGTSDYITAGLVSIAYPSVLGLHGLVWAPPAVKSKVLKNVGIQGVPGGLSSDDTTIDLTNRNMNYAKVNQTADGNIIIGGEFIEDTNNTVRKAKDWLTATDTYSDKKYPSKDIQSFYGIENGKFKVGKANEFNPETEIVPRRFGATNIDKAVLNGEEMRLLDKQGNPIYQNTPNTGKFILYSPSTGKAQFTYINTGKSGVNKVNDFLKKNKDAQYIHLDNGRYEYYGINPENYYEQDFKREGNPGYNMILKKYGGDELDDYQYGGGFLPTRYTSNPYDPAIKNFNDSLNLYKGYVMQDYLMGPKNERISPGTRISWTPAELRKDRTKKWNPILKQKIADDFQNQEEMFASDFVNENNKKLVRYYKSLGFTDDNIMYHTSADLVHPTIRAIGTYMDGSALSPIYKKPVQPVKYADPKVVEKQKILKDAGLYTGELDGVWGSGSKKAWEEYTKRNTTPRSLDGMTEVTYPTSTMIETTKLDPNGNPVTEIHYYDDLRTRERKDPKVQKYLVQTYNQMSTPYKKAAVAKYGDPSKVPFQGVNIYELNPNPYMKEEGGETNLFNWSNLNQWFKNGGESDFVNNIYSDYMDGVYDGTPLEENAKKVYDKLNTIYYRQAKESGMTPPNYIMTNVIKKALKPS